MLETNGNLYSFLPNSSTHTLIDTTVASFALNAQGNEIVLETSGNLYSFLPNSSTHTLIDTTVASFVLSGQGNEIVLETSGNLRIYSDDGSPGRYYTVPIPHTVYTTALPNLPVGIQPDLRSPHYTAPSGTGAGRGSGRRRPPGRAHQRGPPLRLWDPHGTDRPGRDRPPRSGFRPSRRRQCGSRSSMGPCSRTRPRASCGRLGPLG